MPLYALHQLECDKCHVSIPVFSEVEVLSHKMLASRLLPTVKPDPDRIVICGGGEVDPDPAHWHIRGGYPDVVLCPKCKPQPPKPPEAR